nr:MAG TPA: hypothetical protein [Caudoviricetes sp.]
MSRVCCCFACWHLSEGGKWPPGSMTAWRWQSARRRRLPATAWQTRPASPDAGWKSNWRL